jgi:hypothetical protein
LLTAATAATAAALCVLLWLQGTFWIDLATALPWLLQVAVPFTSRHDAKAIVVAMLLLRMVSRLLLHAPTPSCFRSALWYCASRCTQCVTLWHVKAHTSALSFDIPCRGCCMCSRVHLLRASICLQHLLETYCVLC